MSGYSGISGHFFSKSTGHVSLISDVITSRATVIASPAERVGKGEGDAEDELRQTLPLGASILLSSANLAILSTLGTCWNIAPRAARVVVSSFLPMELTMGTIQSSISTSISMSRPRNCQGVTASAAREGEHDDDDVRSDADTTVGVVFLLLVSTSTGLARAQFVLLLSLTLVSPCSGGEDFREICRMHSEEEKQGLIHWKSERNFIMYKLFEHVYI